MFPVVSVLATLFLALPIMATPVDSGTSSITLPVAKRIDTSGGPLKLVQHDQARAAALKKRGAAIQNGNVDASGDPGSVPVTNAAVTYIARVGVGNPATTYDLIIDTGSSNTWVGAEKPYKQTSSSTDTLQPVSVTYGSGLFAGEEYTDTVTLSSGLTIAKQSIGVAAISHGFDPYDGILGLGPVALTRGSLVLEPETQIPTVTHNLLIQRTITDEVISVFFAPTNTETSTNGEVTFGGTDPTKYIGTISYVPLTTTSPASLYWGIDQSIIYGDQMILEKSAGIVDTGTTLILLATCAFNAYKVATGGIPDDATGLLRITPSQYSNLQDLHFEVGGTTFTMNPNSQIWPRSLNPSIGGTTDWIYLIVGDIGDIGGDGLDFINGLSFLVRFYSVFDTTNARVGLARTRFTNATTN